MTASNGGPDMAEIGRLSDLADDLKEELIGAFLHFPTHPLFIKNFATEAGAEVVANIPALNQPDQTQQAVVPFLLGYMQ